MKREFLSNIFLILGLNLLIKPLYVLFIDAEVQNIIGPEIFGLYFALFNFTYLLQFFLDFGIQNYNSQYIASERNRFQSEFSSILGSKVLLAFLFYVFLILGFYLFGFPKYGFRILLLIGIQIVIHSFLMFIRGNISALGFYKADSIISAIDKLILVVVLGWILYFTSWKTEFNIFHFLYAQILSTFTTLVIAFIFLKFKNLPTRLTISFTYTRSLIKRSLPFAMILLLMTLYTRMDGVMLERLLDDNGLQAGIYAASYRIMDALNMVGFLFATLLLPMFAHIGLTKDQNNLAKTALLTLTTIITLSCLGGVFYAQEIMEWLYIEADSYYAEVFTILIFCFTTISLAYVYGAMITASGKLKKLNIIYGLGIVINWSLNIILIPKYFALGAAYATLSTQLVVLTGLIVIAYRDLNWKIDMRSILKIIGFTATSTVIFFVTQNYLVWPWVMEMSFSVLLGILVSFLLGIVRVQYLDELFR